jgi:3-oxoacyl-[acyl-carrier protein] reductase
LNKRPLALITGASRKIGIGSAIAQELSKQGWNIAITYWTSYDESMPWGSVPSDIKFLEETVKNNGVDFFAVEADLNDATSPKRIFESVYQNSGEVTALILSHCYSVDRGILTTTEKDFDLHFNINAKASWLLIKEFAQRFHYQAIPGRIIAMTSDHTSDNLPYGASKGALDRIVIAAAEELRDKRILANVINPGANDTGWMNDELKRSITEKSFQQRLGTPQDTANLVSFLCSTSGEWINGQLLHSDGGIRW